MNALINCHCKNKCVSSSAALSPKECGPSRADLYRGWQILHYSRGDSTGAEDVQDWGLNHAVVDMLHVCETVFIIVPDFCVRVFVCVRVCIQVLFWGLRELKRVELFEVSRPFVRIECAGHQLESEEIDNFKLHPNFKEMVSFIEVVSFCCVDAFI